MLTENHYSIISGPVQYITYLIQTREKVKTQMYNHESKVEIDRNVTHFSGKMRPVTGKIIRMLTSRLFEDHKGQNKTRMSSVTKEMQERASLSSSRGSLVVPEMK